MTFEELEQKDGVSEPLRGLVDAMLAESVCPRLASQCAPFSAAKPAITPQVDRLHLAAARGEAHPELVGVAGRA